MRVRAGWGDKSHPLAGLYDRAELHAPSSPQRPANALKRACYAEASTKGRDAICTARRRASLMKETELALRVLVDPANAASRADTPHQLRENSCPPNYPLSPGPSPPQA